MKTQHLEALAVSAMTCMLSTTIKPGLVDRSNNGSSGIDFFNALLSIRTMSPYFYEIAERSLHSDNLSPTELFKAVRDVSPKAEAQILKATGGAGIFLGGFFAVAVAVAAAGRVIASKFNPDSAAVCVMTAEMAQGLCERELNTLEVKERLFGKDSLTRGERMFMKYGSTGIRGEVQSGFETVRKYALPLLRKLSKTANRNDVYVQAFMTLMAHTMDTNILATEGFDAAEEVMDRAKGILERGGIFTPIGREKIEKLDTHLFERKLSPNGSGALLGVAIFLQSLDEAEKSKVFK